MSYTKSSHTDGDEKAPGMYFLRGELDCENLGFTVIDAEAGWTGMEHEHGEDGQEEVYYLVEGSATMDVDGDEVAMSAGDALRVAADASRQLTTEESSTFVVAGAP
jgi:mannose-6-phosphate isomerase-like protein (cupin superfamily)